MKKSCFHIGLDCFPTTSRQLSLFRIEMTALSFRRLCKFMWNTMEFMSKELQLIYSNVCCNKPGVSFDNAQVYAILRWGTFLFAGNSLRIRREMKFFLLPFQHAIASI